MKLYVLMGHRKEQYPGQYAVEALAVMDENSNDDNPEYLQNTLQEHRDSNEFDALAVVCLRVKNDSIDKALYPNQFEIPAEVIAEPGVPNTVSKELWHVHGKGNAALHCPRCGDAINPSTYVDRIARDENPVRCDCGWIGKTYELK